MSDYQFVGWELSHFDGLAEALTLHDQASEKRIKNLTITLSASAQNLVINACDIETSGDPGINSIGENIILDSPLEFRGGRFETGSVLAPEFVLKTDRIPAVTLVVGRIVGSETVGAKTSEMMVFTSSTLNPGTNIVVTEVKKSTQSGPGQNCFARGTLIETPHGALLIEQLENGDEILTQDGRIQLVSWLGHHRLTGLELALCPKLRPVRIMSGALTGGRPGQDLYISQSHRLLVDDWRAPYLFGEDEILVPAKSLLNNKNVFIECPASGVDYFHLLMDSHQMVCANGVWAESMLPDRQTIQAMTEDQQLIVNAKLAGCGSDISEAYQLALPALAHNSDAVVAA